jgi:hypothetical protein
MLLLTSNKAHASFKQKRFDQIEKARELRKHNCLFPTLTPRLNVRQKLKEHADLAAFQWSIVVSVARILSQGDAIGAPLRLSVLQATTQQDCDDDSRRVAQVAFLALVDAKSTQKIRKVVRVVNRRLELIAVHRERRGDQRGMVAR